MREASANSRQFAWFARLCPCRYRAVSMSVGHRRRIPPILTHDPNMEGHFGMKYPVCPVRFAGFDGAIPLLTHGPDA
jgi:hypothetical protein